MKKNINVDKNYLLQMISKLTSQDMARNKNKYKRAVDLINLNNLIDNIVESSENQNNDNKYQECIKNVLFLKELRYKLECEYRFRFLKG